jgi:carboxyl-terminal processing protease
MNARKRFTLSLLPLFLALMACQAAYRVSQGQPVFITATSTATIKPSLTASSTPSATPTLTLTPLPSNTPTFTPTPPAPSLTPTLTPNPDDLASQLQVFEELWQIVDTQYLYPDFNGLDWNAVHQEYSRRIEAGLNNPDFYLAMEEMITRLGDDHSVFLSPQDTQVEDAQYAGNFNYVGIGTLDEVIPERQRLTILLVYPGSPADEAGLKAHDSILEIDGSPAIDEHGARLAGLRGPEGSQVALIVQSPGEAPRTVTITRRRISGALPVPYELLTTPAGKNIGYIFLPGFNDQTIARQVGKALLAMNTPKKLDGLILDNRENGGGANTMMEGTLAYFTHGLVGHFVNRRSREAISIPNRNVANSQKVPLVVLVGKGSASFGEIFSGILQDMGRAYLIGEQTDGNVEILYVYDFPDGSSAWIAHDAFQPLNHPNQNWEATGITPDQVVASNWDEVTTQTDPAVLAALEHFDGE